MSESSKSTEIAPTDLSEKERQLVRVREPSSIDDQVLALEERSVQLEGEFKQERFFWIVVVAILGDIIAIMAVKSFLLIFPFLLEIALLIWVAKRLGVEEAEFLLREIWAWVTRQKPENPNG